MRRKRGPSKIFSGRYVAQSLTRKRRRGRTGARISVKRLRQAMLRIVRLRKRQPLRRRGSPTSGGRRQARSRATKKSTYRTELRCRENQVWLQVRSHRMPVTFKSSVFRRELQWKILTQAKFSLRRKYRPISRPRFYSPGTKNMTMMGPRHTKDLSGWNFFGDNTLA